MSRRRRHKSRHPETLRKLENLRNDPPIVARRELHRSRRQFDFYDDLPPSKMELPDDLFNRDIEIYTRISGDPAPVHQGLPRNANLLRVRESSLLPALHSYFSDPPERVTPCVRRDRRRRVIFALQKRRKGSGRGKKHNWTEESKVRCV